MSDPEVHDCPLCGEVITLSQMDDAWKQVQGWVGGSKKDSMRLRSDTGRYAHYTCVVLMGEGQVPDQPTLEEEAEDDGKREFVGDDLPF